MTRHRKVPHWYLSMAIVAITALIASTGAIGAARAADGLTEGSLRFTVNFDPATPLPSSSFTATCASSSISFVLDGVVDAAENPAWTWNSPAITAGIQCTVSATDLAPGWLGEPSLSSTPVTVIAEAVQEVSIRLRLTGSVRMAVSVVGGFAAIGGAVLVGLRCRTTDGSTYFTISPDFVADGDTLFSGIPVGSSCEPNTPPYPDYELVGVGFPVVVTPGVVQPVTVSFVPLTGSVRMGVSVVGGFAAIGGAVLVGLRCRTTDGSTYFTISPDFVADGDTLFSGIPVGSSCEPNTPPYPDYELVGVGFPVVVTPGVVQPVTVSFVPLTGSVRMGVSVVGGFAAIGGAVLVGLRCRTTDSSPYFTISPDFVADGDTLFSGIPVGSSCEPNTPPSPRLRASRCRVSCCRDTRSCPAGHGVIRSIDRFSSYGSFSGWRVRCDWWCCIGGFAVSHYGQQHLFHYQPGLRCRR